MCLCVCVRVCLLVTVGKFCSLTPGFISCQWICAGQFCNFPLFSLAIPSLSLDWRVCFEIFPRLTDNFNDSRHQRRKVVRRNSDGVSLDFASVLGLVPTDFPPMGLYTRYGRCRHVRLVQLVCSCVSDFHLVFTTIHLHYSIPIGTLSELCSCLRLICAGYLDTTASPPACLQTAYWAHKRTSSTSLGGISYCTPCFPGTRLARRPPLPFHRACEANRGRLICMVRLTRLPQDPYRISVITCACAPEECCGVSKNISAKIRPHCQAHL